MKCGTTSLHFYLDSHPEISMSSHKELNFFLGLKTWQKGVKWYESQFTGRGKVIGESSPNYTSHRGYPGVPERMYSLIPEAKLIYLVRDPIERMVSQYLHQYSDGSENRGMEEALLEPGKKSYLDRSLYYTQLSYYLEFYSSSQILVIPSEKLQNKTQSTLGEIFEFLDVDANFKAWQFGLKRHRTRRKRRKNDFGQQISKSFIGNALEKMPPPMRWPIEEMVYYPFSQPVKRPKLSEKVRFVIKERLAPDIDQLRNFTGDTFDDWDV